MLQFLAEEGYEHVGDSPNVKAAFLAKPSAWADVNKKFRESLLTEKHRLSRNLPSSFSFLRCGVSLLKALAEQNRSSTRTVLRAETRGHRHLPWHHTRGQKGEDPSVLGV